jgi:TolA-binding protein
VLLPFLAELYTAKKDMASAEKVVRQMSQAPASGGTASVEAQRARGDVAIGAAREAMSSRRYGQVVTAIQSNSAAFTEPRQQADALYLLAQAKEAMATDDPGLKDAAIAYMRVAANFKSAPDAPHVADSLLNTAKIEEKLNQPKSALALYGQIAAEYKGTAAGKAAEESAQRLGAAGK